MITPLFVIQIALLMGSLPRSLAGGTNTEKTDSTSLAAAGDTTRAMGGFSDRAFFATSVRLPGPPPPRTTNGSVRTDQGVTKRPSSATSSETTISATTSVNPFSGCGGQRSKMITLLFVIQIALLMGSLPPSLAGGTNTEKTDSTSLAAAGDTTRAMGGFSDRAFFATSVRLPGPPPPRTTNGSVRTDQGVTKRPSSATSSETTISATTSVNPFSGCGGQRSKMITLLFVIQIALLMGSLPPSLAGGTNTEKTDSTSLAAAGDTTRAMGGFSDRAFFATSVRLPGPPPPRTTNGSVRTDQGVTKRPSSATSSETTISATTSVNPFSGCGGQRSKMITLLFVIQIALLMGSLPPSLAGGTNTEKTDSTSLAAAGDTTRAMGGFSDRAFFATSVRLPGPPPPRTTNGSVRTDQGVTKRPSSATSSETTISATTSVNPFSGCGGQRSKMITLLFVIQIALLMGSLPRSLAGGTNTEKTDSTSLAAAGDTTRAMGGFSDRAFFATSIKASPSDHHRQRHRKRLYQQRRA
ncbi:mucin-5AC-like [Ixodes scapularis]|uniref:mucin-5AC-like n=1 Tax=Ixodes scapularis TaxID=6945 RepID=UPI001A9F01A0|nr:mucin-5AC-like [Ixodes scapularis]